jgi:hypothetical protein
MDFSFRILLGVCFMFATTILEESDFDIFFGYAHLGLVALIQ